MKQILFGIFALAFLGAIACGLMRLSPPPSEAGLNVDTGLVAYASDGTYTLNGTTACMPGSLAFVSSAINLDGWVDVTFYMSCSGVDSSHYILCSYETSPDNSEWFNGLVTIDTLYNDMVNLETTEQVINPTEKAIRWVRLNLSTLSQTVPESTATVKACIVGKKY